MSEDNEAAAVATVTGDSGSPKSIHNNSATEIAIAAVTTSNLQESPPELPENVNVGESCEKSNKQNNSNDDDELSAKERRKKEKRQRKKSRRHKKRKRHTQAQAILVEKPVVGGESSKMQITSSYLFNKA